MAQSFELSRSTIDSGGGTSLGGQWSLAGTIGQPDARTHTGDVFQLAGGFWFAVPAGDCNEDGGVGLLDHVQLSTCISGPDAETPVDDCRCMDLNSSGTVDLFDIAAIQQSFGGA